MVTAWGSWVIFCLNDWRWGRGKHPGKWPLESPKMKIFCSKWCSFSNFSIRWFLASNVNFARVYRFFSELHARGSSAGNKTDLPVLFWKWWPWNRSWFVDPACMAVFAKMQRVLSPGDRQQRHTSSRLFLVGNQILHFRGLIFFQTHPKLHNSNKILNNPNYSCGKWQVLD